MGLAMAKKFAIEGSYVVITGRNRERLEKAKEDVQQFNGQVLSISMDVREPDQVQKTVCQTLERFGRIDGLINNAAGNFLVRAEELSINGWNSVVDIVLNGTWYCSQAVAKEWIKEGFKGSIVNIIATYAWTGCPGVVHSAAAKAGVLAMSKSLAVEWGRNYGIRVNCIAPGFVEDTGGAKKLIPDKQTFEQVVKMIPNKRFARSAEIADVAYFLLSPQAEYINGEVITVDAGASLGQGLF